MMRQSPDLQDDASVRDHFKEEGGPRRLEFSIQDTFQSLLLVEDHPLFVEGFRQAVLHLLPQADVQVVSSGLEARHRLHQHEYDLVFLDLNLPEMSGFAILEELRLMKVTQPIVVITAAVDSMIVKQAMQLGALGAISKRIDSDRLADLFHRLTRGESLALFDRHWLEEHQTGDAKSLTRRELDVLLKLAEGLENGQICDHLGMSHSTLRTHMTNLFSKMDVTNRTACVVKSMRMGWI